MCGTEPHDSLIFLVPGHAPVIVAVAQSPERAVVPAPSDLTSADWCLRAVANNRADDIVTPEVFERPVARLVQILGEAALGYPQFVRVADEGAAVVPTDKRHRQCQCSPAALSAR